MKNLSLEEIKKEAGKKVVVKGFLQTVRAQSNVVFLVIRNRDLLIQAIVGSESDLFKDAAKLNVESVIKITGKSKLEAQAPGGVEIEVEELEVLSQADAILPIPMNENSSNEADQQKRLDWRWLDLRKPKNRLIFEVWTLMEQVAREFWLENNYIQIHSPKLLSVPSEGAAELFEVKYFDDKMAYLAQSPQLYKQMAMASGFEKIFEVGPVFRANPSFTSRHDTEFTGYDMELSYVESHQDVIQEEERLIVKMITKVKEKYGEEIKLKFGRELVVPKNPFPQVTLKKAKEMLAPFELESEKDDDLNPEEERKLSELILEKFGHEFVFVTEYPASARPFYHMRMESDESLTKSFDLLWNGIEITTGAQREHRYEVLIEQAEEKGLSLEPLTTYFNFFKYGCPPHGGLGFGPSRFLMKMLGLNSVREVTYLYRGPKRLDP